jgi:mannose-6-phosphate isomerase-like protein (cupin superfamily)
MDRREFSSLLPALLAATAVFPAEAQTQAPGQAPPAPSHPLTPLKSGQYVMGPAHGSPTRVGHSYLTGLLPDNIRLETHVTFLTPGAPAEPVEHHKHTEMWFMREGTATLMTAGVTRTLKAGDMGLCIAGDDHYITNASTTEPASYYVISVGPPE